MGSIKLLLAGTVVMEGEEGVAKLGEPEVGVEAARSRKEKLRKGKRGKKNRRR